MSRLLVDDVTKTDARALLNVNKMATISDIVAPSNEYIYASGANELTVVEGCVIAVGGAGIFKTANTILTAANLDAGSAFAVGKDYYVYICDSRIDSADEKYVISLNSTYPTGWNATNSRKIGGFHYGRCRKVDSNLQPLNGSSVIFGTGWESCALFSFSCGCVKHLFILAALIPSQQLYSVALLPLRRLVCLFLPADAR